MTRLRRTFPALSIALLAVVLGGAAIAVAAPGSSSDRQPPVINKGAPHSGTRAFATANGTTAPLTVLKVRVKASPKQSVKASGFAKCNGQKRNFDFQGGAPLIRPLPVSGKKPAKCSYAVSAELTGTGTITVDILGR